MRRARDPIETTVKAHGDGSIGQGFAQELHARKGNGIMPSWPGIAPRLRIITTFQKRHSDSIGDRDLEAGRAQLSDVGIGRQATHALAGLPRATHPRLIIGAVRAA
jgi:hypothetical protein